MPVTQFSRRALAVAALTFAAAAFAVPASAHAELVSSDPVDGSSVTELSSIRLEFSEELLEIGNSITVTDGLGATQELEVTLAEPTVLEAPVTDLAPGEITIAWRNASVDGHAEEGEIHVDLVAPLPSPSASPTPTVTVTATESASPTPSATPSVSPSAEAVEETGGVSPWLWGILGLLVIGGAAAALIAATRKPPTGTPSE
ncbi:copper resistance CopC family protein [Demequina sp.]|uniref:copper resistance CopC family protein n=1 Tax=Demequina sp. TaxID=2050685 RepID=UPI003D0E06E0